MLYAEKASSRYGDAMLSSGAQCPSGAQPELGVIGRWDSSPTPEVKHRWRPSPW